MSLIEHLGSVTGLQLGSGRTANRTNVAVGRLAGRLGAATRFLYDGDELVAEYGSTGTLLRRYVHGANVDDPVVWYEGATTTSPRYLHSNHQGSVVAVTDSTGNATAINSYDEWGIPSALNQGRFQYTGQAWIPELGMYYYKARIYSPTLGRFLQTDPIGYDDQINLYAYVGNDPVNNTDPTGMESYLASRPLDAPGADTFMVNHAFIVTNAKYPGDPNATIISFGELKNGNTGNVSEHSRASERSNTANRTDRLAWLALGRGEKGAAFVRIDAPDSRVQALANAVVENTGYSLLPNGFNDDTNSNSAAFAVSRGAGDVDESRLRGISHPGEAQSNRVQFDRAKLCNSGGYVCE